MSSMKNNLGPPPDQCFLGQTRQVCVDAQPQNKLIRLVSMSNPLLITCILSPILLKCLLLSIAIIPCNNCSCSCSIQPNPLPKFPETLGCWRKAPFWTSVLNFRLRQKGNGYVFKHFQVPLSPWLQYISSKYISRFSPASSIGSFSSYMWGQFWVFVFLTSAYPYKRACDSLLTLLPSPDHYHPLENQKPMCLHPLFNSCKWVSPTPQESSFFFFLSTPWMLPSPLTSATLTPCN